DPVGLHLDARGVLLRVIQTDLLDRPAVTLGAGVGDDDAVLRVADHAEPLELNLDCHGCGLSWTFERGERRLIEWGAMGKPSEGQARARGDERAPAWSRCSNMSLCQTLEA